MKISRVVRSVAWVVLLGIAGCGQRRVVVKNETIATLQIELAIRYQPHQWFSSDKFFKFQIETGERWDSSRPGPGDRVEWRTAEPTWVGFRVRPIPGDWMEPQTYSLGRFDHAEVLIRGKWPNFDIAVLDRDGQEIELDMRPTPVSGHDSSH